MGLVQKEIKKVYLGSTLIRPTGWHPGPNTVLYLPLDGDVIDYSTYNRTFNILGADTNPGTPVFDTLPNGKKVASIIATSNIESDWFAYTSSITGIPTSGNMTISLRMNQVGYVYHSGNTYYQEMLGYRTNDGYTWMCMTGETDLHIMFHGAAQENTTFIPTLGDWYNVIYVVDNGTCTITVNGTQVYSDYFSYGSGATALGIGGYYSAMHLYHRQEVYYGKLSEIIIENVAWTQQERQDYFNLTKGDYGIS